MTPTPNDISASGYGPPPGSGGWGNPPGGYGPPGPPGGHPPPGGGWGQPPGGYGGGPPGFGAPPPGAPPGWQQGYGQGQGPGGWGAPPPEQQDSLSTVAVVMAIVGGVLFVGGLVPCLGWLNWLGVPLNLAGLIIGIVGLAKPIPSNGAFIAAVIVGAIGMLGGIVRCILGGFIL